MKTPRILTIQDISCVGQCSLTVALPIVSACGVETAVLPSAVLSTHTAGFKGFTFRDLTDDFPAIGEHWAREGIDFDAFYTGYLGSQRQIALVRDILRSRGRPGAVRIVDPAMADNGRLYTGFDEAFAATMAELVADADYVLPNVTEAALLTGMEYRESLDESYVAELSRRLLELGARNVVLTGVGYTPETTGVVVCNADGMRHYVHRRLATGGHGTGDVYASAFTGALLRGIDAYESARIAADFVVAAIENTAGDKDHWYGVRFEPLLLSLAQRIQNASGTSPR